MSNQSLPYIALGCLTLYTSGKLLYAAIHRTYLSENLRVTGTAIPWTIELPNIIMGSMGLFGVIVSVRGLKD